MLTYNQLFLFYHLPITVNFLPVQIFSRYTLSIADLTFKCIHSNRLCNSLHFVMLFNISALPLFTCIYCFGRPFVIKSIHVLFWGGWGVEGLTQNYTIVKICSVPSRGKKKKKGYSKDQRDQRNDWRASHFFLSHFYNPDLFHVKPITRLPGTPIIK